MKTVQLTPKEFYVFKLIAKFKYKIELIKGQSVFVQADLKDLALIGY